MSYRYVTHISQIRGTLLGLQVIALEARLCFSHHWCNYNILHIYTSNSCTIISLHECRRQISNVQEKNVFVINIRRNERNGVNFEMYISLGNLLVLNQQALFEAVQVSHYTLYENISVG